MHTDYEKNTVLAMLFASGEPIDTSRIADAADIDKKLVELCITQLSDELDAVDSGLCILRFDNRYQLSTRSTYATAVNKMLESKRNSALSQAAMEVLALVAYNQPVSRAFIDQVRGVDSSSPVSTLLSRGLIREAGRLDLPGRPVSFETTDTFMRCFDLSSLEELPAVSGFTEDELTDGQEF